LINNNECSFPKTRNNYKGNEIQSFAIPPDMPAMTIFDDITITPTACVALKLKRLSNNQKVFINIVQHVNVPKFFITDPYIYIANERTYSDKDGETGMIFDAAINDSVWSIATSENGAEIMKQVK